MKTKFAPFRLTPVAALLLSAAPHARAAGTIYTIPSEFTSALDPGSHTENFSNFSSSNYSSDYLSATLTNGTYTAVVTAKDLFGESMYPYTTAFGGNDFLTVGGGSTFAKTITLTFTSGNINAIAGSFFYSSAFGGIIDAGITLAFSDGTSQIVTSQDNNSFFGYIGTQPIVSLTITSDATNHFGSIDNLILGSATIPEPSVAHLLMGTGTLASAFARRRSRKE